MKTVQNFREAEKRNRKIFPIEQIEFMKSLFFLYRELNDGLYNGIIKTRQEHTIKFRRTEMSWQNCSYETKTTRRKNYE